LSVPTLDRLPAVNLRTHALRGLERSRSSTRRHCR
jgi:hypothetical protein